MATAQDASQSKQQTIQQVLDSELQKVPAFGKSGEQASQFDENVYNDLIAQGFTPEQANGVKTYLMTNQYGGSKGVIGQGGGASSFMSQWENNDATIWAPGAAAAIASLPDAKKPGGNGQCDSSSPEFCTLAGVLSQQAAAGAPVTPYLQDNNTPTVVPTQSTGTTNRLMPVVILMFLIAGALGYWYYKKKHGGAKLA